MAEKEELVSIGLTDRESSAYLALLNLEEATVAEISEKTKESRTHLYDTLKRLIEKGFVSYVIKNNIKYFHATSPSKILDYLKEKESSVLRILPKLLEMHGPKKKKPLVEVYEGREGMKTILNDIIRTKDVWLLIGSNGKATEVLPKYFLEKLHIERVKNKIPFKVLLNDSTGARKRTKHWSKLTGVSYKLLPKNIQNPAQVYLYGNKTVIFMWLYGDEPFAISIENDEINKSFRSYFDFLWRICK